jgi:predicted nucleic acid-binding protein
VESGRIRGYLPAHAVTTIFYLLRKQVGVEEARKIVGLLLHVFDVAPVNERVLASALTLACPDFEDAVCAAAAHAARCEVVVTRDPKGFLGSVVPALEPDVVLAALVSPKTPIR